ncbi:MAG TPA: hypothetical protein VF173_38440 [Thermoanaerobaculia bacterium]|nr:hypothetical protein [Thermoanaerobaculia bacterium]
MDDAKPRRRTWLWSLTLSLLIAGLGTTYAMHRPAAVKVEMKGYTAQPDDLGPVMDISTYVVEGTATKVYTPRWTTPNGRRPQGLQKALSHSDVQLRTPVLLRVERVIKGENVPATLLFTFPGGRDQDLEIVNEAAQRIAPGTRIVAFLSVAPPNAGPWAKISPLYPQMIFTVQGGTVRGPLKEVERSEFERTLRGGIER